MRSGEAEDHGEVEDYGEVEDHGEVDHQVDAEGQERWHCRSPSTIAASRQRCQRTPLAPQWCAQSLIFQRLEPH